MKVRWLTGAAHRFIATENPKAAAKGAVRFEVGVSRLATHPKLGCPGRRPGTRELVVAGVPYIVIYRVIEPEVQVLRVYHTSRNWWGLV